MRHYSVPITWKMSGWIEVEAEDEEDAYAKAIESAESNPEIPEGDYVDGSFEVESDGIVEGW